MENLNNAPQTDASATASMADTGLDAASNDPQPLNSIEDIVSQLESHSPEPAPAEPKGSQPDSGQEQGNQEPSKADPQDPPSGEPFAASPPASWGAGAKEVFAKLPPELQQEVSKRETQRESAVNAYSREAAEARKQTELLQQYAQNELGQALNTARMAIEADFAGINWNELQAKDPHTFLQVDALYKQRIEQVRQAAAHYSALEQHRVQQNQAAYQQMLRGEVQTVVPALAALVGDGFSPKGWKDEAAKYMGEIGAPTEHINGITHGYQLQLIAKAMLYDKMQANAQQAASKIAAAPKVMKPGLAPSSGQGAVAKKDAAMKRLRENPKDNDAIVGLLNALDG